MTDTLLALLPSYGGYLLALVTLLSCLAMPIPASVLMLAAGGFATAGDFSIWQAAIGAYVGAVFGDQIGFQIGRLGAGKVERIEAKGGKQAFALKKATDFTRRRGIMAVFFSRWLLSPLGPYVNLTAGAARMHWGGFTLGSFSGEAVWVGIYVGMGAGAVSQISYLWPLVRDGLGAIAAVAVAVLLGLRLWHLHRAHQRAHQKASDPNPQDTATQPIR